MVRCGFVRLRWHALTRESKRAFVKAITWQIISFFLGVSLIYLFTHSLETSVELLIINAMGEILLYYVHERLWKRTRWPYSSADIFSHVFTNTQAEAATPQTDDDESGGIQSPCSDDFDNGAFEDLDPEIVTQEDDPASYLPWASPYRPFSTHVPPPGVAATSLRWHPRRGRLRSSLVSWHRPTSPAHWLSPSSPLTKAGASLEPRGLQQQTVTGGQGSVMQAESVAQAAGTEHCSDAMEKQLPPPSPHAGSPVASLSPPPPPLRTQTQTQTKITQTQTTTTLSTTEYHLHETKENTRDQSPVGAST